MNVAHPATAVNGREAAGEILMRQPSTGDNGTHLEPSVLPPTLKRLRPREAG